MDPRWLHFVEGVIDRHVSWLAVFVSQELEL